jgi:hypothetical protein
MKPEEMLTGDFFQPRYITNICLMSVAIGAELIIMLTLLYAFVRGVEYLGIPRNDSEKVIALYKILLHFHVLNSGF